MIRRIGGYFRTMLLSGTRFAHSTYPVVYAQKQSNASTQYSQKQTHEDHGVQISPRNLLTTIFFYIFLTPNRIR